MLEVKDGGNNIDNDLHEFKNKLYDLSPGIRAKVKVRLVVVRLKFVIKEFLIKSGLFEIVRKYFTHNNTKRINGREFGISNIREVADKMCLIARNIGESPEIWDSRATGQNER